VDTIIERGSEDYWYAVVERYLKKLLVGQMNFLVSKFRSRICWYRVTYKTKGLIIVKGGVIQSIPGCGAFPVYTTGFTRGYSYSISPGFFLQP